MFASMNSPRQSINYQGTPTYLTMAIGLTLSCFALSAQAATNDSSKVEPLAINASESPQAIYKGLNNPNADFNDSELANDAFVAQQTRLFFECTQVQTSAARLACFDKVSQEGKTPSYTTIKQPVDLVKTFQSTLSGNPQVVLAENVITINAAAGDDAKTLSATNQPLTQGNLETGEFVKDEAQILEEVGVTQDDIDKFSALSLAYDLDKNSERGTYSVRPHRPMYLLPYFYNFKPNRNPGSPTRQLEKPFTSNEMRSTELKLQVSLKTKVAEDLFGTSADMWFAYTQQSHWQVYNEDNSRPFRATDYEPEVFITQPVKANLPFGGRLRMLGAGASHHSNGQSDPLSRSWNRVFLMGAAEWGNFSILPKLWTRIGEENGSDDDNSDIEDFMGYGDVTFLYNLPSKQSIGGTVRYNTKTDKGAVQLDYVYPLTSNVNGYLQVFHGYGESLIDYNHENTTVGLGIVLNDWKGL
ncbi:phospholipase A1 [Psychrobacter sp. PL15]|uniref:phospholipase A n=1 Tax=Psychrobacter sp. PL15 TaxID=3071719 RepID=UPI002E072BB8|nr:phospholipase A1 [Psychrobacter sp. PL15]